MIILGLIGAFVDRVDAIRKHSVEQVFAQRGFGHDALQARIERQQQAIVAFEERMKDGNHKNTER